MLLLFLLLLFILLLLLLFLLLLLLLNLLLYWLLIFLMLLVVVVLLWRDKDRQTYNVNYRESSLMKFLNLINTKKNRTNNRLNPGRKKVIFFFILG